jgi:hypothetical protein
MHGQPHIIFTEGFCLCLLQKAENSDVSSLSLPKFRPDGVHKQEENQKHMNGSAVSYVTNCGDVCSDTNTTLYNLQGVLSCHHNIVVSLLADILGFRSPGCLPRQTRGLTGR